MARICDHCHRGIAYGHAVSHAKNRTKRLFAPNLQKLKVSRNGSEIRVKFCTSCIKRLKRDRRLGPYGFLNYLPTVAETLSKVGVTVVENKEASGKKIDTLKIEDIVG